MNEKPSIFQGTFLCSLNHKVHAFVKGRLALSHEAGFSRLLYSLASTA